MTNQIIINYDFSAIDNADLADSTKLQYRKALKNYLNAGNKLGDAQALSEYARGLNKSSRAFLKAAIRLVSSEFENSLKSGATPENLPDIQAALYRLEALNNTIKVKSSKGEKIHVWLSSRQVHEIMSTCGNDSLIDKRDWIVLGLLLGAGLRREEIVNLKFDDLVDLPTKDNGLRTCLQVEGKGSKNRVIPINKSLASRIQEWKELIGSTGYICRSIDKGGRIGNSLSVIGIFEIVRKRGALIGISALDPHDARRTFAQLGYDAGIPLTQISKQLGHSSLSTTQAYLNLDLDLLTNVSDFIPLE